MSADERVNAAWVLAAAPKSVRAMVAEGWRPVMHECVAPPQWNHDHKGTVDLTADDIAWFNGADVAAGEPESTPAAEPEGCPACEYSGLCPDCHPRAADTQEAHDA